MDPDRTPRTIAELDKYAEAIDTWETRGGTRHLKLTGYIPLEPGLATNLIGYWFGAKIANADGTRMLLNSPGMFAAYNWIRGYSERMGKDQMAEFRSGFSSGATGLFNTPQNPFLVGWNAMEQQGPWIAAFIEKLKPSMNRWHVPPDQVRRGKDFDSVEIGMSLAQVQKLLGPGDSPSKGFAIAAAGSARGGNAAWPAGIKDIYMTFIDEKVSAKEANGCRRKCGRSIANGARRRFLRPCRD